MSGDDVLVARTRVGGDLHLAYVCAGVVFTERIGPFVVERAGHFLQWERADVLNAALRYFCAP